MLNLNSAFPSETWHITWKNRFWGVTRNTSTVYWYVCSLLHGSISVWELSSQYSRGELVYNILPVALSGSFNLLEFSLKQPLREAHPCRTRVAQLKRLTLFPCTPFSTWYCTVGPKEAGNGSGLRRTNA